MSYDMIDRFLRNNLDDDNYAEYSAALDELCTPPAQQEPLEYWNAVEGWVKIDEVRKHFDSVGCATIYKSAGDGRVPLTSAQRTWVGLLWGNLPEDGQNHDFLRGAVWAEAKLKELNQ